MKLDRAGQIIVNGGSMRPFYRHGQRLLLKKVDESCLRPGDAVLFRHPRKEKMIFHRIRRKKPVAGGTMLLMRGDNNCFSDGWIDSRAVEALAVSRVDGISIRRILKIEDRLALVLAPLLCRFRKLVISVLAFCVRFLYSYIRLEKVASVDSAGVRCIEAFWHGRVICRRRSSGRAWVHPVFSQTDILKEIVQELK